MRPGTHAVVCSSARIPASSSLLPPVPAHPAPQIDRQEAMLRADQRRLQIERANKILFDETDRVRGFHSTLQKADIIQENEALIGYKKQIGMLRKAQEAAFVEQQRQALEQADAAELAKLQLMKDRALQQKTIQMKQVDDFRNRIITERREDHREGLLLKQRAVEEEEEMRQKEITRRRKAQDLNDVSRAGQEILREKESNFSTWVGDLKEGG
jgi:hypothetical protein